uniref:hypothetical protein n=1 Tax=Alistipes sp. TaxID=1872444 RepID=UPI0040562C98
MWRRVVGTLVLVASMVVLCYVWLGREHYKSLLPASEAELSAHEEPLVEGPKGAEGAEELPLQPEIAGDSTLVERPLVEE